MNEQEKAKECLKAVIDMGKNANLEMSKDNLLKIDMPPRAVLNG